jgi:hypothetical protein
MLLFIADSRFKRCRLDVALELAIKAAVTLLPFHTTDQREGLPSRDAGHRVAFLVTLGL